MCFSKDEAPVSWKVTRQSHAVIKICTLAI